ncbi:hypothetical protein ACFVRD_35205 [Streptomyces sp. NPDC057908]|uniref:hypothetical protein n=1 Tax=Streptomyces sp. NPDC057908 TaxID=3346276 RepID=UPI0036E1158B
MGGESAVPCRHGEQTTAVLAHPRDADQPRPVPDPDGWRYAVHFTGPAGIADGALAGPPPSSEPDITQAALVEKAEELTHRRLDILWHAPNQPDWWTGTVTVAGPLPPA